MDDGKRFHALGVAMAIFIYDKGGSLRGGGCRVDPESGLVDFSGGFGRQLFRLRSTFFSNVDFS